MKWTKMEYRQITMEIETMSISDLIALKNELQSRIQIYSDQLNGKMVVEYTDKLDKVQNLIYQLIEKI